MTKIFYHILQIGAGGNGSYLAGEICQMLSLIEEDNKYFQYKIADPDLIEKKNLNNQFFIQSELNQKKASALVKRYSLAYGLPNVTASQIGLNNYISNPEMITEIFNSEFQNIDEYKEKYSQYEELYIIPVVIGAVDNLITRKYIAQWHQRNTSIWIDIGNEDVDPDKADITGYQGQILVSVKIVKNDSNSYKNNYFLKRILNKEINYSFDKVSPELIKNATVKDKDSPFGVTCINEIQSNPQRIRTNKTAANACGDVIQHLIFDRELIHKMIVFNAQTGERTAVTIK